MKRRIERPGVLMRISAVQLEYRCLSALYGTFCDCRCIKGSFHGSGTLTEQAALSIAADETRLRQRYGSCRRASLHSTQGGGLRMMIGGVRVNRLGTIVLAAIILGGGGMLSAANAQDVEWTGLVNVSVDGTILQKTGGCDGCDDAGAQSQDQIDSPGGYVEFTVGEVNTFWIGGLSNGNGGPSYSGIDYAIRFNGAGGADVLENGYYKGGDTSYAAGDIFRLSVAYGRVQVWRNGTVVYTSRTAPTYPLVLDVAFGTVGASLYDAQLSHDIVGDPPPPPPPLTESNITWTDIVHVTPGDRVLEKTDGCGGCDDAGARSVEEIEPGDGHIEFTVGEMGTFWVAGLGNGNTDTSYGDVDFGFRFNGAGIADVLENGVYKGGDTLYTVGDIFSISVADGQVSYRHNGELVYVSQITATYPLLFDTALGSMGARIYNANLIQTHLHTEEESSTYNGGFWETDGFQVDRLKSTFSLALVPSQRGQFTFGSEYNFSEASRLTDARDCGAPVAPEPTDHTYDGPTYDCVHYVGYPYWRRLNNHTGNNTTIYILLGLEVNRGGGGPTLFAYNKPDGAVTKLGPLFDENDPDSELAAFSAEDAEMWYFSADPMKPTTFYAFRKTRTKLWRFDAMTNGQAHAQPIKVVMDLNDCPRSDTGDLFHCPATAEYFDHPHSSDDDRVHIATVVRDDPAGSGNMGCMVFDENAPQGSQFRFFAPEATETGHRLLDECALDKSGQWLVMHEAAPDDELVISLDNNAITRAFRDAIGGHSSHSDLGYGYEVGADNVFPDRGPNNEVIAHATTVYGLAADPAHIQDRDTLVHYTNSFAIDAVDHLSHQNAVPSLPPEQQYACGSNATTGTHRDEIICFSLDATRHSPPEALVIAPVMTTLDSEADYAHYPKGNLDVSGEYFLWTTNLYNSHGRLDAFIVRVPKVKLKNH